MLYPSQNILIYYPNLSIQHRYTSTVTFNSSPYWPLFKCKIGKSYKFLNNIFIFFFFLHFYPIKAEIKLSLKIKIRGPVLSEQSEN